MSDVYRIFGAELSPYSIKVRSYLRYKKIPHEWVPRSQDNQAEFQKYAKLPLVPLVVTPDGEGIQDSTPIIERFEKLYPQPAIHPAHPVLKFISAMIEEYGDEWGNKWMFHYRWWYAPDQISTARRLAQSMMPALSGDGLEQATDAVRQRMVPRLSFVGSSPATKDLIENSFKHVLSVLERHLESRKFLLGERPAFADFGLYAQIYQASTDPTAGGMIRQKAPRVLAWAERMLTPSGHGEFEPWENLEPTLMPLLKDEIGTLFIPWSAANAAAIAAGQTEFSVELGGHTWTQKPQKYHARSLGALREKYAALADKRAVDAILQRTGGLAVLSA